jgi:hypothetical protein
MRSVLRAANGKFGRLPSGLGAGAAGCPRGHEPQRVGEKVRGGGERSVGRGSGESPPDTDYHRGAGSVRSAAPTCHNRTQGELPGWRCVGDPELGGSPVADSHNSRALSAVPTAKMLSSLCHVLKRTISGPRSGSGGVPRLLPCRPQPPPRVPNLPIQARDGDVRAGSTVTAHEDGDPVSLPIPRRWSDGRGER